MWLGQKAGNSSQDLGQGEVQFPLDEDFHKIKGRGAFS